MICSLSNLVLKVGLATSTIFSILPADTVAGAEVLKGPGSAASPASAAGGTILLEGLSPLEMPGLEVSAITATDETDGFRHCGFYDDDGDQWGEVVSADQAAVTYGGGDTISVDYDDGTASGTLECPGEITVDHLGTPSLTGITQPLDIAAGLGQSPARYNEETGSDK